MVAGMSFAVLAFLISALLEYKMQQASLTLNPSNQIRVLNLLPCDVDMYNENGTQLLAQIPAPAYVNTAAVNMPKSLLDSISIHPVSVQLKYSCSPGLNLQPDTLNLTTSDASLPKTLIFYLNDAKQTQFMDLPYNNKNEKAGSSQAKFVSLNTGSTFGTLKPVLYETGLSFPFKVY